ncbi:MAG: hypothetical protein JO033_27950 [Acidobacteriaceae bacterium]|nr:hypothetical protein [Acidobacteriaceae bacterium]
MILLPDPGAGRLLWQLAYQDLSPADTEALTNHYQTCRGPFRGFTFIDPTDNMFVSSSDLTNTAWGKSESVQVESGQADPVNGTGGFALTNTGETDAYFTQTLPVPASYAYTLSLYLQSAGASIVKLIRGGPSEQQITTVSVGPQWTRVLSSGALNDYGTSLSAGIILSAGQQVSAFGLQLEAQPSPSQYRATAQTGGVYTEAHWSANEFVVVATGNELFSTTFGIDTAI